MTRKPFTFNLMGHDIRVTFTLDTDGDLWGEWQPRNDTILLQTDAPQHEVRDAFFHELLHAIATHIGLELPEPAVRTIALGLGNALADKNVIQLLSGVQPTHTSTNRKPGR